VFLRRFQFKFTSLSPGEKEIPEIELTHLDGHKGSKPVRVGNGAADHVQLASDHAFYICSFD
jgi:hypothetical protein